MRGADTVLLLAGATQYAPDEAILTYNSPGTHSTTSKDTALSANRPLLEVRVTALLPFCGSFRRPAYIHWDNHPVVCRIVPKEKHVRLRCHFRRKMRPGNIGSMAQHDSFCEHCWKADCFPGIIAPAYNTHSDEEAHVRSATIR